MEAKFIKYYREMPAMFTCAAALNPTINVQGVENMIECINNSLNLNIDDNEHLGVSHFNNIFTQFYNHYDELYGSRPRQEVAPTPSSDSWKNMISQVISRKKSRTSSSLNDLGLYTKTDFRDFMSTNEINNFNILEWWKNKCNTYPVMSIMARDILTIQASTVASESAFSLSGRILNEQRSRLTDESLELCICYKDYLDANNRVQHINPIETSTSEFEEELGALNLEDADDN